jgi:subtilisin family serine protease
VTLRHALFGVWTATMLCLAAGSLAGGIYLRTGAIDTDVPGVMAMETQPSLGAGYYLLQLKGPVSESHKQALTTAGATLIEYIPDDAFLVRMERSAVAGVKRLACVKWVGPFRPEHKQSPAIAKAARGSQFVVQLFPGQDSRYVIDKGKRFGAKAIDCKSNSRGDVCRMLVDSSKLSEIAKIGAVAWIEPYVQSKLCNDVASGISGVPDARQDLSLFGAGQLIGVADSGLDSGDVNTISADFASRVQKTYTLRRPGDWSDLNGHGTHVTGSVMGSGVLSGSNPATHSYSGSFAGYAPEARLVFQSIGDSGEYVFPPLHLADLFQPVYNDGVRVHSDSWGSAVNGEYTVYSSEVDQFVWDHKDFTAVFAIGNEGRDTDHNGIIETGNIYAPATAKNCISVGATENLRASGGYQLGYGVAWPSDYPVAPIKYDLMSNNANGLAAFSGRGPTTDGRVKPDVCAPGTNIISCKSHPIGDTGWGVYNSNYIYWGGTSMSTPQVAGAAALVRQYYQQEKATNPSAALIKATMINGALDISPGQYGSGSQREAYPVPDNSQGWGRLNLKRSLCPAPPVVNEFADESAPLSTDEYRDYLYTVVDNSVPLKVTLAWTDYPGAVHAAKELVNDLDLTVSSPTGATLPFAPNRTDNVEQVTIANPQLGTYRVRVDAYDVPMGPQDYALVVSGGLPGGYIAGTVTSSSGAPVQGATITFVSAGGNKRMTTNSSGQYVSHVAPGDYSVQVSKQGWTFSPRAQFVHVESAPVEGKDFQGTGSPGAVTGRVTQAIGGVTSHIVESSHPYLNSTDQIYTVAAHASATRIRVHFAEIDLMNDGDEIRIQDMNSNLINTFTGKGEDFWSSWVTGSSLNVRLITTDTGNIAYGFYIDGYETDLIDQGGLGGAVVSLSPGNYSTTSNSTGNYSFASVPPGVYSVSTSMPHWKFQPPSKSVDVPAGGSTSGADFQGFPPGSITGEIHLTASQTTNCNIQSDPASAISHDYDNNVDKTWTIIGDPSATRIRVHFSRIGTEAGFDWVWVLDSQSNTWESYTGDYSDLWSPWIDGHVAQIELTTDQENTGWGFLCDSYEVETMGGGLAGATINLSPDSRSATTGADGTFAISSVDVGDHVVTPAFELCVCDPTSATVSTSAGVEQHIVFYAGIADLTRPSQAKSFADGTQATLTNLTVTAVFNGCFYAQDSARTSGVKVISTAVVAVGDKVDVTGALGTQYGERRIIASKVTKH